MHDIVQEAPASFFCRKSVVFLPQSARRNAEEGSILGKGTVTIIAMLFHHRVIEDTEKV